MVYLAYSLPYTYSKLLGLLKTLEANPFVVNDSLCYTLSGVQVPFLTITDFSVSEYRTKDHVIITARVHPGESHSS